MSTKTVPELTTLPLMTKVNRKGHLVIGGCDVVDLASEFGTSRYSFDKSALSSNHNALPRSAMVIVKEGRARLIRRRETYQDLMSLEVKHVASYRTG
jgi:hypothetical protein